MISIYLIPLLVAFFLAMNMGASGTAPSFAAPYGADLIRKDLIPGVFGLFVFAGVIIAGKKVVLTIGKDILPSQYMNLNLVTIILLSVALSLFFANLLRVPQSTSQSTVFALIGPALYYNVLKTEKLFFIIIPTWFITPLLAFLITYLIGRFLYNPLKKRNAVSFKNIALNKKIKWLVLISSCYVSFSIGSNNVANAAGPILAMACNKLGIQAGNENFLILMLIVSLMIAPFFGIGSSFGGARVLHTTGKEILDFGPMGAVLISVVTATLLLIASLTEGIPTSLVQMNIASILGLGIYKLGIKEIIKNESLKKVFTIWIVAPIIALTISWVLTYFSARIGLL